MSEEAKTPEGDYVMMGSTRAIPGRGGPANMGLDDPNLTQEEKDHRLAIALQQQENAAVYATHQKKHNNHVKAQENRTARSATFTRLAAVRDQDHGMLSVPKEYTSDNAYKNEGDYIVPEQGFSPPKNATPQEIADAQLASELQKLEQVDAGTTRTMQKIVKEETEEEKAQTRRTGYSNYQKKR
ncbi:hypothetical protein ACA910_020179 [Epithemia clementina (nom. ined.)]